MRKMLSPSLHDWGGVSLKWLPICYKLDSVKTVLSLPERGKSWTTSSVLLNLVNMIFTVLLHDGFIAENLFLNILK